MEHGNNPRNLHEGHFTAHVGLYPKFNVFMSFYQDAAGKLYREVSEGNETADRIAIPLLFMMRHALELGYKYTITELCQLNGASYNPRGDLHSFKKLHPRLKKEFDTLWKNGGASDSRKAGFDQYYELTEAAMTWFDEIDPCAENFRYPQSGFARDKKVNLLEVKNKFDEAMALLAVTVDVISDGMQT
jgi:hypothetical protein